MEARLSAVFKSEDHYTIIEKFKGKTLENKGYTPLFDYFKHLKEKRAFRVLCDTYVTESSGTGCVHQVIYMKYSQHIFLNGYSLLKYKLIVSPNNSSIVSPFISIGSVLWRRR